MLVKSRERVEMKKAEAERRKAKAEAERRTISAPKSLFLDV